MTTCNIEMPGTKLIQDKVMNLFQKPSARIYVSITLTAEDQRKNWWQSYINISRKANHKIYMMKSTELNSEVELQF